MRKGGKGGEKKQRYNKLDFKIRAKGKVAEDHGLSPPRNQNKS
jgi:hypothetical protein